MWVSPGHRHVWQAALSRRQFIGTALASGAALALPALAPAVAHAKTDNTLPNAINGGTVIGPFGQKHFYFPANPTPLGVLTNVVADGTGDPSTIRDFNGIVGLAEFPPTGVVTGDPLGGVFWAADLRFMQGQFIDRAGHQHRGTLSFI
jgi:hypothetical protein